VAALAAVRGDAGNARERPAELDRDPVRARAERPRAGRRCRRPIRRRRARRVPVRVAVVDPTRPVRHATAGLPRGRMSLIVRSREGRVLASRLATNLVLRGGAELVARRLVGLDSVAIDHVGVGFGRESADVGVTALTPPTRAGIDPAALASPIAPADFTLAT